MKIFDLLENQKELLVIQQENGGLLSSIVDDILDSIKIQNGKIDIAPYEGDLMQLCKNIVSFQQNTAKKKNLKIHLEVQDSVSFQCKFDGTLLKRVLNNLINNAIKFTEHGYVDLKLELLNKNGIHQSVRFSVKDTGLGIENDKQSIIFEPFKQEDSSVRRHAGGTGLGLFICKNIIQAMGSEITLTSEKGKGTEFSFILELELSTQIDTRELTEVALKLDDLNILVVDDNKFNCTVLAKMLQGYGAKISLATSGEEALKQYMEQSPRVVFMDYHMPEMDGYEASMRIRKLEKDNSKVPSIIIACTADAKEVQHQRFREADMDDIITKPLSKKTLEKVLLHHLHPVEKIS
jgi:two-component system, sensor histidine kinase